MYRKLDIKTYICADFALVVELVDTQDLKSCGHCGRAGSSPARGTFQYKG